MPCDSMLAVDQSKYGPSSASNLKRHLKRKYLIGHL